MLEYQNIEIFLQKFTLKTDQNRLLRLKKFKKTVPWTCAIEEFNGEDIVGTFYKRMKRITKEKSKFRV